MSRSVVRWLPRVVQAALSVALLLGLALGGLPIAHMQDLDCENDPIIEIRASDGKLLTVHVSFAASRLLANGMVVSHEDMWEHLQWNVHIVFADAVRLRDSYEVRVISYVDSYQYEAERVAFPVSAWLSVDEPAVVGPRTRATSVTGAVKPETVIISNLTIPAPRVHQLPTAIAELFRG